MGAFVSREEVICTDAISLLDSLDPGSASLIIADPPYGIGYHSNRYKDRNPHAPITRDWNFQIGGFLQAVHRSLQETGALYLFCRWDVLPLWTPLVPTYHLKVKTMIVWMKDNWSAGDLTGSFGNQYETILFITKGRHQLRGKRYSNIWCFPRIPARRLLHPAQKPVELLERMIESSSDAGDIIVDPFCGSGSTGEAAQRMGRGFLLGDIDPNMIRMTSRRLGLPFTETPSRAPVIQTRTALDTCETWGLHPEEIQYLIDVFHHRITEGESQPLVLPLFNETE